LYNLDVSAVDVRIRCDEVICNDAGKQFNGNNRILLGEDVAGLFLGIGSDND